MVVILSKENEAKRLIDYLTKLNITYTFNYQTTFFQQNTIKITYKLTYVYYFNIYANKTVYQRINNFLLEL